MNPVFVSVVCAALLVLAAGVVVLLSQVAVLRRRVDEKASLEQVSRLSGCLAEGGEILEKLASATQDLAKICRHERLVRERTFWRTADGRTLRIHDDMTPRHAGRARAMILRDYYKWVFEFEDLDGVLRALRRRAETRATLRERWRDAVSTARWRFDRERDGWKIAAGLRRCRRG